MRPKYIFAIFASLGLLLGATGPGCKMMDRALLDPNPLYVPPGSTNAPAIPVDGQQPYMNDVAAETWLTIAKDSGMPYGALAGSVGLWLMTMYRNVRNKQTARALVEGIAGARNMLKTTPEGKVLDEKVKAVLRDSQLARGVLDEVKKLMDTYTSPDYEGG